MNTIVLLQQVLTGQPAYAELPAGVTRPVARLEESGGPAEKALGPWRLFKQDVQADIWGESKGEALDFALEVRRLLLRAPRYDPVHDAGVITGLSVTAPSWVPDETWPVNGRPGPRYMMSVSVTAHD